MYLPLLMSRPMNCCPVLESAKEAGCQLLSCPDPAEEAALELPVPSVTTEEVMGELPDCCIAPLEVIRELLNYKCTPYLSH